MRIFASRDTVVDRTNPGKAFDHNAPATFASSEHASCTGLRWMCGCRMTAASGQLSARQIARCGHTGAAQRTRTTAPYNVATHTHEPLKSESQYHIRVTNVKAREIRIADHIPMKCVNQEVNRNNFLYIVNRISFLLAAC
jgi:hypothetical protein